MNFTTVLTDLKEKVEEIGPPVHLTLDLEAAAFPQSLDFFAINPGSQTVFNPETVDETISGEIIISVYCHSGLDQAESANIVIPDQIYHFISSITTKINRFNPDSIVVPFKFIRSTDPVVASNPFWVRTDIIFAIVYQADVSTQSLTILPRSSTEASVIFNNIKDKLTDDLFSESQCFLSNLPNTMFVDIPNYCLIKPRRMTMINPEAELFQLEFSLILYQSTFLDEAQKNDLNLLDLYNKTFEVFDVIHKTDFVNNESQYILARPILVKRIGQPTIDKRWFWSSVEIQCDCLFGFGYNVELFSFDSGGFNSAEIAAGLPDWQF